MKKTVPVLGLALAFLFLAGEAPRSTAVPSNGLSWQVDSILGQPGMRKVLLSACVVRCETGEVVYQKNARLALVPASNMKIVTSAAAVERLGQDFSFVTRVGLCGDTLVVVGGGDPLLGDRETDARNGRRDGQVIRDIAARLKEMGVSSISEIVLDTSIFDGERVHPSWPKNQLNQRYACEVSGLNYHGNCVDITAVNRRGKVVLALEPPTDYVRLINALAPGPKWESWFSVHRTGTPCELLIRGNCGTQAGPYAVAVENPALFFGHLLRDALVKEGVGVEGAVLEGPVPKDREFRPVTEYATSIEDCLLRTNKDSLGLAAEALFKMLGAWSHPEGKPGSWEGGQKVLSEYLSGLGIDEREFKIADGSGLSRDNRLSANALTRVLVHLSAGPCWDFFRNSLAVGGYDGTIENHFWEREYRGRVMAKSGYIQAVRALSGVVNTQGGDFIFSFLANRAGRGSRAAIDRAVKAVMDWGDKEAGLR
jgi:D-alanyl-D-alanine carboxypeptidase/D-alanyl-D-alanine-endopeptidase (penicillin-binding protein 4)